MSKTLQKWKKSLTKGTNETRGISETVLLCLAVMPKMKSEIPWHLWAAHQTVWTELYFSDLCL